MEAVKPLKLLVALLAAVAFMLPVAAAQGEIFKFDLPEEQPVLEQSVITIGVRNTDSSQQSYKLEINVIDQGKVVFSQPLTFALGPGRETTVSSNFVPENIGSMEVVAKLSDQYGLEVDDIETKKIRVVSEIGPFDIAVDTPSNLAEPGIRMPIIVTLINMGQKGTDVQVKTVMDCQNEPDISQDFYVFMPAQTTKDNTVVIDTCTQPGRYQITSSISIFNRTWISASSQIFLNKSENDIFFEPPDTITVRAGSSTFFDLAITNDGRRSLTNVRLLLPKIPPEWVDITPQKVDFIRPNETAIFIVNITPPLDAPDTDIIIGISAAADQILTKKDSKFRVLSMEGEEVRTSSAGSASSQIGLEKISSMQIFGLNIYIAVGIIAAAIVAIFFAVRIMREEGNWESLYKKWGEEDEGKNTEKLKMMRDQIRG